MLRRYAPIAARPRATGIGNAAAPRPLFSQASQHSPEKTGASLSGPPRAVPRLPFTLDYLA